MIRQESPFNGKPYLLNKNTNEVHDLKNETAQCRINEIKHEHIEMFDSLNEAFIHQILQHETKNGCYWCLKEHHTY